MPKGNIFIMNKPIVNLSRKIETIKKKQIEIENQKLQYQDTTAGGPQGRQEVAGKNLNKLEDKSI